MKSKGVVAASMLVIFIVSASSAAFAIVNVEGHGVCALQACNLPPCYPLTIIKECGDWFANYHGYPQVLGTLIALGVGLSLVLVVFKSHMRTKGFYVVRYRGD